MARGMMMGGAQPPNQEPAGQGPAPAGGQADPGAGQMLDTADTAGRPQSEDMDTQMFEAMVAGLRQHIFGKGEQPIVKRMKEADDPGRVCGEVVFSLVREAAKQAQESGMPADVEILMAVATEVIDDITELMAAYGVQMTDKQREYALLVAQQLYVESSNPTDEERADARNAMADMKKGGDVDEAVKYVQQRGAEEGVDPFGVNEMRPGMMGKS